MLMLKIFLQNRRALLLRWLAIFLVGVCLVVCVFSPYLSNTFSFLSHSINGTSTFYGVNVDMSQILPTSSNYVVNSKGKDLIDRAADLGINLLRITNALRSFDNGADSIYTRDQWNQVLDKMQSKGIKALILIETDSKNKDYYTRDIRPVYLSLVQKYVDSGVFSHPDVYAVDIKNEPILTDDNLRMLQAAHALIKDKYPKLKQTIGWWATYKSPSDADIPYSTLNWSDFLAGRKLADMVDFYSVHMYLVGPEDDHSGSNLHADLKTMAFISQVENGLRTTKPILIEEFGAANGDAVTDQNAIGSPELQANLYQGVYEALKKMSGTQQVLGAVAYHFYSRNEYPDAWAIVKNKGDYLFPAAYVLQAYALGEDTSPHQLSTTIKSRSYLVKNADNDSTATLHVSDRIGLKVQLDADQDYSVSLSKGGMLRSTEVFHYEYSSNSYQVVYQASSKGKVELNIVPDGGSADPVYTLMIEVV